MNNGESPTIPDDVRNALIRELFVPKNTVSTENKGIVEANSTKSARSEVAPLEYTGEESFGDLMQQVMEKKEKQAKENVSKSNVVRESIIKNIRMDILEDWKF